MYWFSKVIYRWNNSALREYRAAICLVLALLMFNSEAVGDVDWVNRADEMRMVRLTDWDLNRNRVRLLYQTTPDLEQSARGDWATNIYVAELHPDGKIDNHKIHSSQRNFSSAILQRGGNKVFAVVAPAHGDRSATLESWSIDDGTQLSSVSTNALMATGGSTQTIFPTADGHFFIVSHSAQSARGGQPTTIIWTKMNDRAEVLARGEWSNPSAVSSLAGGFAASAGGMGTVLALSLAKGSTTLQTDVQAVQNYEIAGRAIEARVFSETRMLVANSNGSLRWLSPALERVMMWDGDMTIPQDLPIDQMMAQNEEQMALMARVALENGGDRSLLTRSIDQYVDVQKTPTGYGLLVRFSVDRSLDPPMHGTWFVEIGDNGSLRRNLRLQPIADQFGAQIERFLPTADGGMVVAGSRIKDGKTLHVTALHESGTVKWSGGAGIPGAHFRGIAGTEKAPWVFGQGWREDAGKNLVWAELINPAATGTVSMSASSAETASSQAKTSPTGPRFAHPTAPPASALPESAEGCTCSCEEFAVFKELSERLKSASQAEMLSMVSDPSYQASMSCMGGCAMAYAQCGQP